MGYLLADLLVHAMVRLEALAVGQEDFHDGFPQLVVTGVYRWLRVDPLTQIVDLCGGQRGQSSAVGEDLLDGISQVGMDVRRRLPAEFPL